MFKKEALIFGFFLVHFCYVYIMNHQTEWKLILK